MSATGRLFSPKMPMPDARVVQVDGHPQSDRKDDAIDGVEQAEPAAHTTIAEPCQADCRRRQKHRHDRPGQMSSRHGEVRRCVECRSMTTLTGGRTTIVIGASSCVPLIAASHIRSRRPATKQGLDLVAFFATRQLDPVGGVLPECRPQSLSSPCRGSAMAPARK